MVHMLITTSVRRMNVNWHIETTRTVAIISGSVLQTVQSINESIRINSLVQLIRTATGPALAGSYSSPALEIRMRGSSAPAQARHSHTCCLGIDLLAPIYTSNHHSSPVCLSVFLFVCLSVRPSVGHWTRKRRVVSAAETTTINRPHPPTKASRAVARAAAAVVAAGKPANASFIAQRIILRWPASRQFLGTCYIFRDSGGGGGAL